MREIQSHVILFLDDENEDQQDLINFFKDINISENRNIMYEFLCLLSKISKNHHRYPSFFDKIEHILEHFKNDIISLFSNIDLFKIFKRSNRLLLYLIKNSFMTLDDSLANQIITNDPAKNHFFYPEIEQFLFPEQLKAIKSMGIECNSDYYAKRKIGENDSKICTLIRDDLVEEFITYVHSVNYPLDSLISGSIYETNTLLQTNKDSISLIEYASFFGAIQIIKYLQMNGIELTPSLWIYAIHSNNADLIHYLEDNHVKPNDPTFGECLRTAIKCHHNDIANYFQNNILFDNKELGEKTVLNGFRYFNYEFLPSSPDKEYVSVCIRYNYLEIVEFLLKNKIIDLNERAKTFETDPRVILIFLFIVTPCYV